MPQQQVLTKRGMACLQGYLRDTTTRKDMVTWHRFCSSMRLFIHEHFIGLDGWLDVGCILRGLKLDELRTACWLGTHHEVEHTLICNGIAKNPNLILASINRIQSNSIDTWHASHLSFCPSLSVFPLICPPVWLGCMQAAATMTCSDYRRQLLCTLWILNTDIVHTDMYRYRSLLRLWIQECTVQSA